MIDELLDQLRGLKTILGRVKTVNVNIRSVKDQVIDVATDYFQRTRSQVLLLESTGYDVAAFDDAWQQLIRLAHGNNQKKSYSAVVQNLLKLGTEAAILTRSHGALAAKPGATPATPHIDQLLIDTIERLVPSAAQSYRQGVADLHATAQRCSFRGTACELREALREVLDHLAPDEDVTAQAGFKLEPNTVKPTMKQKVRFILKSRDRGKTTRELTEKSVDLLENLSGSVARAVYDRASLSTHTETTRTEVQRLRRYLDAVLYDILEIKSQ
jgi:hypothetical protein